MRSVRRGEQYSGLSLEAPRRQDAQASGNIENSLSALISVILPQVMESMGDPLVINQLKEDGLPATLSVTLKDREPSPEADEALAVKKAAEERWRQVLKEQLGKDPVPKEGGAVVRIDDVLISLDDDAEVPTTAKAEAKPKPKEKWEIFLNEDGRLMFRDNKNPRISREITMHPQYRDLVFTPESFRIITSIHDALRRQVESNRPVVASTGERRSGSDFISPEIAKDWGLTQVIFDRVPQAQRIIDDVRVGRINVDTEDGKRILCERWFRECKWITPPFECYQENGHPVYADVGFLRVVLSDSYNIMFSTSSDSGVSDQHKVDLEFGDARSLYMDSWLERDLPISPPSGVDTTYLQQPGLSPLLSRLTGRDNGVALISREEIDLLLWDGDPASRTPTSLQSQVLRELGLDSSKYMIRLVNPSEFLRCGQLCHGRNIETMIDGYMHLLSGGGAKTQTYGLSAGVGSISSSVMILGFAGRQYNEPSPRLAVRLVVAPR